MEIVVCTLGALITSRATMEGENLLGSTGSNHGFQTKLFKRRWLVLAIFCALSFTNAGQWVVYASISTTVHSHYGVSLFAVNCLSLIYAAAYVVFIIPVSWLLDTFGLKITIVLGASFNALGAWLKPLGSSTDGFGWIMAGQFLCSVAQCFILGIPSHLSAAWFGERERSIATAIGVFANQLGVAVCFAVVPVVVQTSSSEQVVSEELQRFHTGSALICTLVLAAVLVGLQSSPPVPPSTSQAVLAEEAKPTWRKGAAIANLMHNPSFVLLTVSYGLYAGVGYTFSTVLEEMLSGPFPKQGVSIGFLGFAFILAGLPGTVLVGVYLDRTFAYKKGAIIIGTCALFTQVGLTLYVIAGHDVHWLFPIIILYGFFAASLLPLGVEFAAELTYPTPVGLSAGIVTASGQLLTVILILIVGEVIQASVLAGNLVLVAAMMVNLCFLTFIKSDLHRHQIDMPGPD